MSFKRLLNALTTPAMG